jgi:hypothetical protein
LDETAATPAARKWVPRFSLLTVLLVMNLVACGITIYRQWRELVPMRAELKKLRNEVGALTIDDETKLHAILMPTTERRMWKWRVWVPEGANVTVHYRWNDVPVKGVPKSQRSAPLFPGENIVSFQPGKDDDGNWRISFSTPSTSYGTPLDSSEHWFDWDQMVSTGEGIGGATTVLDDKSQIYVLKRERVGHFSDSRQLEKVKEPTTGFIIWLEQH